MERETQAKSWKPQDDVRTWPARWDQLHEAIGKYIDLQSRKSRYVLQNQFLVSVMSTQPSTKACRDAIVCLAQLAFNLLMFPWKAESEYRTLSKFTGFYVHRLCKLSAHATVLKCMGYEELDGCFQLAPGRGTDETGLRSLLMDLVTAEMALARTGNWAELRSWLPQLPDPLPPPNNGYSVSTHSQRSPRPEAKRPTGSMPAPVSQSSGSQSQQRPIGIRESRV